MIEFVKAYKASDNEVYPSLADAQIAEMDALFSQNKKLVEGMELSAAMREVTLTLLEQKQRFVDVLTMAESSIPKARAVNGGKKPRKSKKVIAEQFALPGVPVGTPPMTREEIAAQQALVTP